MTQHWKSFLSEVFTYLLSIVQEVGNESYPEFSVEKPTQSQSNGSAHRVNRCYRRGVTARGRAHPHSSEREFCQYHFRYRLDRRRTLWAS
ncbi:Uncharacterised protein [Vibrio cholerae]|nr:Uncharacterised protein [Vibrio cholerae]CSC78572.1 Uncharacterised protein [Vibrio cholerae]CSC92487.1 Uncharacterised protein [Vibrio cholerae]